MRIAIRAPCDTGEGADFYNRRMVEALRRIGCEAAVISPGAAPPGDGWLVVADARTPEAGADAALVHRPSEAARRLIEGSRLVIAAGEATAARLRAEFGADPSRLRVVPPGAEHGARSPGSGGACLILSVGAVAPRTGCEGLLRALGRLGDLPWRLTLVGATHDAEYAAGLRALAQELRIAPRVTIAGAVGDEAMEALWMQADVFALASAWKPHGTGVANALARGVPVAAIEASAAGVDVPPDSGALCGDETALSKALRRILCDAELRAGLAEGAWRAGQALPDWDARARVFADALAGG